MSLASQAACFCSSVVKTFTLPAPRLLYLTFKYSGLSVHFSCRYYHSTAYSLSNHCFYLYVRLNEGGLMNVAQLVVQ